MNKRRRLLIIADLCELAAEQEYKARKHERLSGMMHVEQANKCRIKSLSLINAAKELINAS